MSDANQTVTRVVREIVPGQTPANPAFRQVRTTGGSVGLNASSVTSQELPGTSRRVKDMRVVGIDAGGEIPFELAWDPAWFELAEASLFGNWANKSVASGAQVTAAASASITTTSVTPAWAEGMMIRTTGFGVGANNGLRRAGSGSTGTSVALAGGATEASPPSTARVKCVGFRAAVGDAVFGSPTKTITISATSGTWTSLGITPGEWVKVSGATGAAAPNNGWCRVLSVTATVLTFDHTPTAWVSDAGTGMTISVWLADTLRDGVTYHSYSIEREFADLAPYYQYSRGYLFGMSLDISARNIITGSFTATGREADEWVSVRMPGATSIPAGVDPIFDASNNSKMILEGGVGICGTGQPNRVLALSMTVDNQITGNPAVCTQGFADVNAGTAQIGGTLETYFDNPTIANKVLNGTESSITVRLEDDDGRTILWDAPRVRYTAGGDPEISINSARPTSQEWAALEDADFGHALIFHRFEEYE